MTPAIVFTQLAQALKLQTVEQCWISQFFLFIFYFFSTGIIRALGRSPVLLWILFSTWSAVGFWRLLEKYNIFIIAFERGGKKKFKIFISKCSKLCSDFHTLYLLGNDF